MKFSYMLRAALCLSTFLSIPSLQATSLDDDQGKSKASRVHLENHPNVEEITQDILTFMNLCEGDQFSDAISFYRSTDSFKNIICFEFHLLAANTFLNQVITMGDEVDKLDYLLEAKSLTDPYKDSHSNDLYFCRSLSVAARESGDCDNFYTYATKALQIAKQEATIDDYKNAFISSTRVQKHTHGYLYWMRLLKTFPGHSELTDLMYTVGAQCCFHTGHYDDAITTSRLAIRSSRNSELVRENTLLVILSLIHQERHAAAASILENCTLKKNITDIAYIANLYAKCGKYNKCLEYLKVVAPHQDTSLSLFNLALETANLAIKSNTDSKKKPFVREKKLLLEAGRRKFSTDFEATEAKHAVSSTHQKIYDAGRHIRKNLILKHQITATHILQDTAHIEGEAYNEIKASLNACFEQIMACRPTPQQSAASTSTSTTSATTGAGSGLLDAQSLLSQMQNLKSHLFHIYHLQCLEARKRMRHAIASSNTEENDVVQSAPSPSLRTQILKEKGLPLGTPKPHSNVDGEVHPASSAPVADEAPFIPSTLAPMTFLNGSALVTFQNIMNGTCKKVTNTDVKTLILALADTRDFEVSEYDESAGKGSHAKIKLYRTGTPKDQRPKPVILPNHHTLKDYSAQDLKRLLTDSGLVI